MAVQTTTFKGARYLVKFPGEWSSENSYEAIEAVLYNGCTYISKQPVPVGVQIDNTDFWLLWADPNAQMEQLRSTVENYVELMMLSFATVAEMKSSTDLKNGSLCVTAGFHSVNDGGNAMYIVTNSGTANEKDVIECGNLFANLVNKDTLNVKQFGAYGDGLHDDFGVIDYIIKNYPKRTIYFPAGHYIVSEPIKTYPDNERYSNIVLDYDAKISTNETIDCIIYLGGLDPELDQSTSNYLGVVKYLKGGVIDADDATWAIMVSNGCHDYHVSEMRIYNATSGIKVGKTPLDVEQHVSSADGYYSNLHIKGKSAQGSIGIHVVSLDCCFSDIRTQGFQTGVHVDGSQTFLTRIHNTLIQQTNTGYTWADTVAFKCNKMTHLLECYGGGEHTFVEIGDTRMEIIDSYYTQWFDGGPITMFNFTVTPVEVNLIGGFFFMPSTVEDGSCKFLGSDSTSLPATYLHSGNTLTVSGVKINRMSKIREGDAILNYMPSSIRPANVAIENDTWYYLGSIAISSLYSGILHVLSGSSELVVGTTFTTTGQSVSWSKHNSGKTVTVAQLGISLGFKMLTYSDYKAVMVYIKQDNQSKLGAAPYKAYFESNDRLYLNSKNYITDAAHQIVEGDLPDGSTVIALS